MDDEVLQQRLEESEAELQRLHGEVARMRAERYREDENYVVATVVTDTTNSNNDFKGDSRSSLTL